MMNPLNTQPRDKIAQDNPSMRTSEEARRETGLVGWIRRQFGAEHPHKQSPNFFVSDVTDGGIGSHHHHQVYRPDKRH